MIQTLVLGAVIGGAVAFIWGAISWMLLPWHHATFLRFRDEDAVSRLIAENAPVSGVYGLPAGPQCDRRTSREEKQAIETAVWEKMKSGPLILAVVQRAGFGSLPMYMTGAFLINVVASLLLTWLLLQTEGLSYFGRVGFVAVAALAGAVICRLPDWNWHSFSASYTAVLVADAVIGWTLVGFALAALTGQ